MVLDKEASLGFDLEYEQGMNERMDWQRNNGWVPWPIGRASAGATRAPTKAQQKPNKSPKKFKVMHLDRYKLV